MRCNNHTKRRQAKIRGQNRREATTQHTILKHSSTHQRIVMPSVPSSASKRSASAKKGWIKRRENAALLAQEKAQVRHSQAQTQEQGQGQALQRKNVLQTPQPKLRRVKCESAITIDNSDDMALIEAIAAGDNATVANLLLNLPGGIKARADGEDNDNGIDLKFVDKQGTSALIQAVKYRNMAAAKQLLEIPAVDVNTEDTIRRSAMVWAVYSADIDMVLLLMTRVEVNVDKALVVAASCGYEDIVNLLLLESGCVDVNAIDHDGNTALICAIRNNREGTDIEIIVDMLLTKPELDVTILNKYGDSALIQAVRARNYYVVDVLLGHHSSSISGVDFIEHKDIHGVCAFTWALHCNCCDIAHLLADHLAGAVENDGGVDVAAPYGKTSLTVGIVRLLWDQYNEQNGEAGGEGGDISPTKPPGREGVPSAGVASWNFLRCDRIFNKYIINQLLSRDDLFVNKHDQHGYSALTWAMSHKYNRVVGLLLDRADVMVNRLDREGRTPLLLACRSNDLQHVELLLRRNDLIVNVPDAEGRTAIDWALTHDCLSIAACLVRRMDVDLDKVFRQAIDRNDERIISLMLKNMPFDKKIANKFLDKMLQYAQSCRNKEQENGGRNLDNIETVVSMLEYDCQQLSMTSVHDSDDGDRNGSGCAARTDTAASKVTLYMTVILFCALNYLLNSLYETFTDRNRV
jgi:ankyrin repeat protein